MSRSKFVWQLACKFLVLVDAAGDQIFTNSCLNQEFWQSLFKKNMPHRFVHPSLQTSDKQIPLRLLDH